MDDELLGLLIAKKNAPHWFTTKEYVDTASVEYIVQQVISERFTIIDGELSVEDQTQNILSDRFAVTNGSLFYDVLA